MSAESNDSAENENKYPNFIQQITKSAQKAKCELCKVAQQIHVKSYKSIDKNIEQQQKEHNYSLSTKHVNQQINDRNINDNIESDMSDNEWMEIVITKKPKQQKLINHKNNDKIPESLINNNDNNTLHDLERKDYLDTIHTLNSENDKLFKQFNELKQRLNDNNQVKNNNEWRCSQCTLVQTINNKQCILCHAKNASFNEEKKDGNDYKLAVTLQQQLQYKRMKQDEQLAIELHKIEEKQAQHISVEMRNRNRNRNRNGYPATCNYNRYNSNRIGIGNILMNMFAGVQTNDNYNISNDNNNYIEPQNVNNVNVEYEWKRLPVRLLNANDITLLHKTQDKKSCAICLVDFKIRDETRQLPCFHLFHTQCIDIWFQQQNDKGKDASCPLDRKKISEAVTHAF